MGKKCAATGKTISYEPDARVCPRCERVYMRRSVPKKCKCGNSLVHLRPKSSEGEPDEGEAEDGESDESASSGEIAAAEKKVGAAEETAES